ncbi:MAG TPA: ATP-binding protein [Dehalococcoidia bacterium]|nr:ATP-binding protein [Dehalococcoidia bacterium]
MKSEIIHQPLVGVAAAVVVTGVLTASLAQFREDVGLLNIGLLFLLLTLIVASVWGRYVGFFTAAITNVVLNYFFIEPVHEFTVHGAQNAVALLVFLGVSIVGGSLLSTAREAEGRARKGQAEAEVALTLSRAMSLQTEPEEALGELCKEAVAAFAAPGAAVLTSADGSWTVVAHAGSATSGRAPTPEERAAADRAAATGSIQGLGQTGLHRSRARVVFPSGRRAAYASRAQSSAIVPLKVGERVLGTLRLDGPIGETPFRDEPERLLNAVAGEAALAIQRMELSKAAAHADALREADQLKSALLNAVSHDLRTPLASIVASAGSLQQTDVSWTDEDRLEFSASIEREAQRLNRLVGNLLDLSRIESGNLRPEKDWYDLAALIDEVLGRMKTIMERHAVRLHIEPDLPPISLDYIEIDEVLTNLLENATKYTPQGTEIDISARRTGSNVVVEVADSGAGIPEEAIGRLFEPFYRVRGTGAKGTGLGLAVARGLIEAHGGRIWVRNRDGRGAVFGFSLPLTTPAPGSSAATL